MSSQRSQVGGAEVQNILMEAAHWTPDETVEKLPSTLSLLINFLKKMPDADDDEDGGVQVARFALGSFLPYLQVDHDAFRLLNSALPVLQNSFVTSLGKCIVDDENDVDAVNQILQQCIMIIECCLLAVQFLTTDTPLCVENIEEVPKAVLHIMNGSLQHCTKSKDIYADCFELVNNSIAELCHQTLDLVSKFANFASKITFDTLNDEDVETLIFICEQLCITSSCLSQLSDLRAFVSVWRVYASFVCQHYSTLTTSLDTAVPIKALVEEIRNGFQVLVDLPQDGKMSEKTQKIMQRTIKTINFCLKIVVSLCEKFRGYLRGAHPYIASLLLVLFRFSPGNVLLQKFPSELKNEVERQTTIGIEPILLHLRNDEDFVKVLFEDRQEIKEEISKDQSSLLLLLVTVAVPSSATVLTYAKQFFTRIFSVMQPSHVSLSYPCEMDGIMCKGRQLNKVSLYEYVLTRMCVLVANVDGDQFNFVEEILIEWLLCGQTWPALLASDIWCFISRYGTSDLCLSHCSLLIDVLLYADNQSHQYLMTASLLSRLILKLAPEDKEKCISKLKEKKKKGNANVPPLLSMLQSVDVDKQKELTRDICKSSVTNIKTLLSRKASEESILSLKNDLRSLPHVLVASSDKKIGTSHRTEERDLAVALAELWNRIPEKLIGASSVDQILSFMVYASILVLECFSNLQLYQILSLCKICISHGAPDLCMSISNLLGALGHISILSTSEDESTLLLISECLSILLKSADPVVHQCALEAFITFGKHTVHETVLPMCLERCDEDLQGRVTNYLKQDPLPIPASCTRLSILQQQIHEKHLSCASSRYISIDEVAAEAPGEMSLPEDERGHKRKRTDESKVLTSDSEEISSLMRLLHDCQQLLDVLKSSGATVTSEDKNKIKKRLQAMLNSSNYL